MRAAVALAALLLAAALPSAASARRVVIPPPPSSLVDVRVVCSGAAGCDEVTHRGQRWVVGDRGRRYAIALANRTGRWVEAVVTVDGRNILDGARPSARSRGYLLEPWGRVEIEGWRTSQHRVAAFRFTSVANSYAGRAGDGASAGVIRVEVYPERGRPVWTPPPHPVPCGGGRCPEPLDDAKRGVRGPSASVPSERAGRAPRRLRRHEQRLGTEYGESRWQPATERDFARARPSRPDQVTVLRYDDRRALGQRGILPRPIESADRGRNFVPPPPGR